MILREKHVFIFQKKNIMHLVLEKQSLELCVFFLKKNLTYLVLGKQSLDLD